MTKFNRMEMDENGVVTIRFKKDDGGWHRTAIDPGGDLNAQLDMVNAHLVKMGMTEIEATKGLDMLERVVEAAHTKELIDDFAAKVVREP